MPPSTPPQIRNPLRVLVLTTSPSTPLPTLLEVFRRSAVTNLNSQDPNFPSQHPTTAAPYQYGTTPSLQPPPRYQNGRKNGYLQKQGKWFKI
ncbi:MAG: hypothetical protein Q9166_000546 [cf. Caloplaca sp. 2 TL-2023]